LVKTNEKGNARIYLQTENSTIEVDVKITAKEAMPKSFGDSIKNIVMIDKIKTEDETKFELDLPPNNMAPNLDKNEVEIND
jgi:hypothetical protein